MSKLRLIDEHKNILPTTSDVTFQNVSESKYVTAEQLDSSMNNIVERLAKKIEPESALTPEVRGMVKAVGEVQSLRLALKDPTSAGIEEATSTLVTNVLSNALTNMTGGGQQQAQPAPLRNTLAQIAVSNLTGENSPLPQLMDALTNILGKQKVREGFDAGMQYVDQQQRQNNLPTTILQFDENSQEDVVAYAQQMGYSDVQYAQTKLIEHKNTLHQEIEEYQRVQSGGQQSVAVEEPIVQQEVVTQEPVVQPVIEEQYVQVEQEYIEEPIVEEPVIEEPILKANKVIVLHSKPRKLTLVTNEGEPIIDDKDYEVKADKNLNINVTYSEDNESNESLDDNGSLDDDVDDILDEIGE